MRGDPHKLVEGCLVAGRAMNATAGMLIGFHDHDRYTDTQPTSTSEESSTKKHRTFNRPSTRPTRLA